jgi:hypothetical protein
VVGEASEPGADAFGSLDEVVDRFGGPLGDRSVVPVGDSAEPAGQGAFQ